MGKILGEQSEPVKNRELQSAGNAQHQVRLRRQLLIVYCRTPREWVG